VVQDEAARRRLVKRENEPTKPRVATSCRCGSGLYIPLPEQKGRLQLLNNLLKVCTSVAVHWLLLMFATLLNVLAALFRCACRRRTTA
jgi:hypothetical protein